MQVCVVVLYVNVVFCGRAGVLLLVQGVGHNLDRLKVSFLVLWSCVCFHCACFSWTSFFFCYCQLCRLANEARTPFHQIKKSGDCFTWKKGGSSGCWKNFALTPDEAPYTRI